jgi:hypothetical protein
MLRIFLVLHLLATWTTAYITLPVNPLTPTTDYDGFDTTAAFVLDIDGESNYPGTPAAMTDNWAIVGAYNTNKAFIFKNTNGTWDNTAVELDQNTEDDLFGKSVAITDNWAIVGAEVANKAFIFKNTNGIWDTTAAFVLVAHEDTIKYWDAAAVDSFDRAPRRDGFGASVAITDNWAIVGAWNYHKAFVFFNADGIWGTTAVVLDQKTTTTVVVLDPVPQDDLDECEEGSCGFGHSVAITDNWAIVTAYDTTNTAEDYAGKAFIFKNTGGIWDRLPSVALDQNTEDFKFGGSVAMTDNWAIVGAEQKAFIFKNMNGTWSTTAAFAFNNPWDNGAGRAAEDSGFGYSVAMTDNRAIVAGEQKAFIFKNTNGIWSNATVVLDQNTWDGPHFAVAMTDKWAMINSYVNGLRVQDCPSCGIRSKKAFMFWLPENICPKHSSKLSADGSECVDCESRKYAWLGHHTECIDCEKARTLITMNQGGVYRNSKSSRARFIQAFAQDGACGDTLTQATCTQLKNEYQRSSRDDKCECRARYSLF